VAAIPDSKLRDRLKEFAEVRGDVSIAEIAARFGSSGYVVESVSLSLYAAQQVLILGFEEMMRELICVGGDTDSLCTKSTTAEGIVSRKGAKAQGNPLKTR
jgi:ADP-ribosylglycohydrolase